ncbi:GyrI-like domain-containing protein [Antrihabitans cavernicola]|uniref:AraC family transcriptional regulator n=1 Tax=Antrihabitans cavernicola TaxID=2495913 RepID=A0A5A7SHX1_9NOCA|nr:GyrI-like domain-containing protein [Spelaeibacter cavernicola]KAA0024317.1 AraC family transcriptional regulator [Spelaeibacter cavernicola]
MQFQIVERDETWVAGLPVRSPKRALGRLRDLALEEAWSAVLKQQIGGPLASIYTDFAPDLYTYNTQIVGYQCSSLDEVTRGHIVARVPRGRYAVFSAVGEFPNVMTDLWTQITYAEEHGQIKRSFLGDFECYPHAYGIEMFLAIESEPSSST